MAKVGRPLNYKTETALKAVFDDYFNNTPEERWTITELASICGLDRRQLIEYGKKQEFYNTIKQAKEKIQASYERSLRQRGNAGDIFALKNFGWTDKQEIEQTTRMINVKDEELQDDIAQELANIEE